MFSHIITIAGTVCLFLAAFGVKTGRVSIGWLGLALIYVAPFIKA